VTTHYLDEAEHCHRIAIMNTGRMAALGSSRELKQMFARRPIVEIHSARPVEVMRHLEDVPAIEKTTVFGTAVHAVLRTPDADLDGLSTHLNARGLSVDSISRVAPSLEDVFLDVVEHA